MSKTGIDISSHNGYLDFEKIKKYVDFVMVRAGYGTSTIDDKAKRNIEICNELGIPVGAYWFSYAHTIEGAKEEAKSCCEFLKKYDIALPVAYDFEYDSEKYIKNEYGITVAGALMCQMAEAFMEIVKSYGFTPMLYTNLDYINRGFKNIVNKNLLWLAQWDVNSPTYECFMWQKSSKHTIPDVQGKFDLNTLYEESATVGAEKTLSNTEIENVLTDLVREYEPVALDVLRGVYGNGVQRKARLKAAGYDPILVQCIVNRLVK